MSTVNTLRSGLIEKILAIKDRELLLALDQLVSSSSPKPTGNNLSEEQLLMLEMSQQDIETGNLISQEAMIARNLEWLKGK
ncbi:MAG: hypothetical protein Q8J69_01700 [Sphingobacteriaceae bacterium]|nr:hypothetical protein [Sphingobacteriaceae bacterium]